MRKAGVLSIVFVVVLLDPCSAVEAQQPKNVARLGFLDSSTAPGMAVLINTLREELTKLGWAEGKNETVFKNYLFSLVSRSPKRRGRQTDPFFNRPSFRPRRATSRSRPSHQSRLASQPVPTWCSDRSAAGAVLVPCCHSSRSSPAGRPRITGYAYRRPHRS